MSNLNKLTIVSHCHSDYNDIWPAFFHYLNKINLPKVIGVNSKSIISPFIDNNTSTVVEYDESFLFPQRILNLLSEVKTPYILYIQDNFIPIFYNLDKLNQCINWLESNSYDGLQLYIHNSENSNPNLIKISDDIYTYENSVSSYPYTVHPCIWNRDSLFQMFLNHKNSTYRNIEIDVSDYVFRTMKVFRFANVGKTLSTNGCRLLSYFKHIHIINFRMFNHFDDFGDLKVEYENLFKRFNFDITKRRMRRCDEPL